MTAVSEIARVIERRKISRIVHFHCDHFEPFGVDGEGRRIGPEHIRLWNEDRLRYPHAAVASLFLSSQSICYVAKPAHKNVLPAGDIFFDISTFASAENEALDYLSRQPGLDFHYHLHHEFWTGSKHSGFKPDSERDLIRIKAVMQYHFAHFAQHLPFDQSCWGFVHGCWALNASDTDICNVTNELRLLMEHGCIGDFTFPAGRPWCNPEAVHPYTIVPFDGPKCYSDERSLPVPVVHCGQDWHKQGRILIWSARIETSTVSLDSNTDYENRALLWVLDSPIIEGILFLKTHCHSMGSAHWPTSARQSLGLTAPHIVQAFNELHMGAVQAGVSIEHASLGEIINILGVQHGNDDLRDSTAH